MLGAYCWPDGEPEDKGDGNEIQGVGPGGPGSLVPSENVQAGTMRRQPVEARPAEDQEEGRGERVTDLQLQQEQRTQTWAVRGLLARGWLPGVCGT